MTDRIMAIIDDIIRVEGGYSNHPDDRGGETKYGITVAAARANGYAGPMMALPKALAQRIYLKRYVEEPQFDKVMALSESIGVEMIDTGVNMGPARPTEFLQRWLNGFNTGISGYQDLFIDGRVGPITLDALNQFLRRRGREGEKVLLTALNCSQGAQYLSITESNISQRAFLYGWVRARVSI